MRMEAVGLTDTGRRRPHNEDAILLDPARGLFAVCDGMGGAAAGEVASRTCLQVLSRVLDEQRELLRAFAADEGEAQLTAILGLLDRAVQAAAAEIHALGEREPERRGMGTTLALVLAGARGAIVAHVGDSRVYLLRQGMLHRLTEDHTLLTEQLRHGLITAEQAAISELRSVLTRVVGTQPRVQLDTLHVELMAGDRMLLCSDGLTAVVEDALLARLLRQTPLEDLPRDLIDMANARGGPDNISVIALEATGTAAAPARPALPARKIETLAAVPLFAHLSYRELAELVALVELRRYRDGEPIVREGEPARDMFVLLEGAAAVSVGGQRVARLETGEHFGEMCLVEDAPRSATVAADGACEVMAIGREELYALLKREQPLAVKLLWAFCNALARRLRETSAEVSDLRLRLASTRGLAPAPLFGEAGGGGGGVR